MAQQQMICLSTSLFSSKKNWHLLLSEAIAPFTQANSWLKSYKITFNYLSGENIRLTLFTDLGNEEALAEQADGYFKSYFEKANLPQQPVKLPVNGIFMPFPGNTIQYGLYPPEAITATDLNRHLLSLNLSKIIVAALQDEIDDETILTFGFYLQISLVKTIYKFLNDVDALFTVIAPAITFKPDDDTLSNLSLMKEITDDVMQTERFDSELNWLNRWSDDCATALLPINKVDPNAISAVMNIYQLHLQTIYSQLGINTYGRDMLNYFVIKSLELHFDVNNR